MLLLLMPVIGMALMAMLLSAMELHAPDYAHLRADAAVQSMAIYRQSVVNWATANPLAPQQVVPDASLIFPYGYVKNLPWTNLVATGHGWVYSNDPLIAGQGGMASMLLERSEYSMNVGTNVGGFIWSPRAGNLNIPVDASIPLGSLLWRF